MEVVRIVLSATLAELQADFGSTAGIAAQLRQELRTLFGIGSARVQSPVIEAYFAASTQSREHAGAMRMRAHARKLTSVEQSVLTFNFVPPIAGSTAATDPAYASSATQLAQSLRAAVDDLNSGLYTQTLLRQTASILTTGVAMYTCADNILRPDCNPTLSSSGSWNLTTSGPAADESESNGFRDLSWWILLIIFASPVVLLCLIFILVRCCCMRRRAGVAPKTIEQQTQVDRAQSVFRYVNKPTELEMELYNQSVGLDANGKPIAVQIPSPSQQHHHMHPHRPGVAAARPLERLAQIEEADYQERQLSARGSPPPDRFATPSASAAHTRDESLMSPEEKRALYEERILQAQRAQMALQREEEERMQRQQYIAAGGAGGAPVRRNNLNLPPLRIQPSSPGNLSPMRMISEPQSAQQQQRSQGVSFEPDATERQRSMPPAWHTPVRPNA